jgi:hypothetical protein
MNFRRIRQVGNQDQERTGRSEKRWRRFLLPECAGLLIRLVLSRFSLTLSPICSILKTLRGVAPGVCVYTPGLDWLVPWRDWLEQATGCRTFYVSSQAKALTGPTPAVLTRTDLFGSG